MASAMVKSLLRQKAFSSNDIGCTCGEDPSGPKLAAETGIHYDLHLEHLLRKADAIVLACKPQQLNTLDPSLEKLLQGRLVISILAGVPLQKLDARFYAARNIVRAMPNTPGQIGAGMTAYASRQPLTDHDRTLVQTILGSMGVVIELDESEIDPVTAVSGSGPAYLFEFTAALQAAAEATGLKPAVARQLARETIRGAALLMAETGEEAEDLRNAVTSPGGTTEAALKIFQSGDLRGLVSRAVEAAHQRSRELAENA